MTEYPILARYRVLGGPASVDQRLTVFEDGRAELDERHRSRDRITLQLGANELERLRSALDEVPPDAWSSLPALPVQRLKDGFLGLVSPHHRAAQHAELRRGGKSVAWGASPDPRLTGAAEILDDLRLRSMRSVPR